MTYRQGTASPGGPGTAPAPAPAPAPIPAPAEDMPPFDGEEALDRAEEDTL